MDILFMSIYKKFLNMQENSAKNGKVSNNILYLQVSKTQHFC